MNLLDRLKGGEPARTISTLDDYAAMLNQFTFGGIGYSYPGAPGVTQTLAGRVTEMAANNYVGLAQQAYQANGVVFACMMVRQLVFSSVRFQWQRMLRGKPSETYGTPALAMLERPWTGGTTQDLLSRMIQDADLAGNSYWTVVGDELVRLRPDWVDVGLAARTVRGGQVGWVKAGYVYTEGGRGSGSDPVAFLPSEVAHFAPIPDPLASYRGMSWLTPILREIRADQAMTVHQGKFFDNGATPNMIVKHPPGASPEAVERFAELLRDKFEGAANAYKTLNLYPGADAEVVGSNLKDIDFTHVRGGGETRIAAAAGIPPVIVGLSEGLAAATYSNYGQARRRLADGTAHPLWQNMAGSLEHLIGPPDQRSRLWYDASDVPFLREDEKDAADIAQVRAATINTYVSAGFTADSAVKAVDAGDINLLAHSGLVSVQLLPPGTQSTPTNEGGPNEDA